LWIIDDLGQGNRRRRRRVRRVDAAPNKPNHSICCGADAGGALHIGRESLRAKNKANPGARGGRDWGLQIGDRGLAGARYARGVGTKRQTNPIYHLWLHRGFEIRDTRFEIRVHPVGAAPNKPNLRHVATM
jgi:hypothetical protein